MVESPKGKDLKFRFFVNGVFAAEFAKLFH